MVTTTTNMRQLKCSREIMNFELLLVNVRSSSPGGDEMHVKKLHEKHASAKQPNWKLEIYNYTSACAVRRKRYAQ